ncbi:MAG: hypothetical protein ABEJ04_05855 [Halobacteriaceae archaeon]
MATAEDGSLSGWWVLLFVVLALAAGVLAVQFVGGSLMATEGGFLLP